MSGTNRSSYNRIMNNEISNKPCGCGNCEPMCTTCGRPWIVCKGECGCKKPCCCNKKVDFCEYGRMAHGCIRERAPECPMQAVIPSVVVESVSNLKNLADCFVHVTSLNTTFYIDDKHRTMVTWAGPVEYDNYDLVANPNGFRSQFLLDFANDRGAYYDKTGNYKVFNFGNSGGLDIDMWKVVHPLFVNDSTMVIGTPPIRYINLPDDAISEWGMTSSDFELHQGMRCAVAVNGSYQSSTDNDEMGIAIRIAGTNYDLKPIYKQYKYLSDPTSMDNLAQPLLFSDIPYTVNADTILELIYVKNNYYDGWIVTNI